MDFFKQFIKNNPNKVLGEIKETTDRFGNPDITIVGSFDNINRIDVSSSILPSKNKTVENINVNQFSEDLESERLLKSIEITHRNQEERVVFKPKKKERKGFSIIIDGDNEQPSYTFKESHEILNKGISDDTISVWLWHNNKKGISLNSYSESLVPISTDKWFADHLKKGTLCYDSKLNEYIPSILYYAGNIYDKIQTLIQHKSLFIDKGLNEQYDLQLKNLKNILPPALKLTGKKEERLVLSVLSSFVKNFEINIDGENMTIKEAFKNYLDSLDDSDLKYNVRPWHIVRYYIEGDRMPNHWDKFEKINLKRNAAQECVIQMSNFLANELKKSEQERIEFEWNKQNNGYVDVSYDKIPLFMQYSKYFKKKVLEIRDAQREGIAFQTSNGTGIIAYDVGVGKTLTAILNIGYAMQNGICKRPLIVVPKPTYDKWIGEINGVYENGELVLSGLLPQYPIVDLFNLDNKRQAELFDSKGKFIGIPEGSISICTYEGMQRIGFSEGEESSFVMELKEILSQGYGDDSERKKALEDEKLNKIIGVGQENTIINIDECKFDYLTIDEAHNFNKIFNSVKGESKDGKGREKNNYQIRGSQSSRAIKAFFISNYIQKNTKFGNICLLTATPFTNNPLEVYNILALTNIKRLDTKGVKSISSFFDNYVNQTFEKVIKSTGEIEEAAVIKGWNNKISLQKILFSYMNYKSGEDVNIERPIKWTLPKLSETIDGVNIPLSSDNQIPTYLKPTEKQKQIQKDISNWLIEQLKDEELSKKAPYLVADIMAKKNCISPYVYEEKNPFEITPVDFINSSPKLKYTMDCIESVRNYHLKKDTPVSCQVIYINGGVDYLFLIKEYLIETVKYKRNAHEYKKGKFFDEIEILAGSGNFKRSDEDKEEIKDLFNKGIIKIIIGTSTIREGIDLQVKSSNLYALWVDWNPTSYKQLEGRIWRYGNEFKNIRIITPLLVGSSDAFTYQKLEEKTSRINDIFDRNDKSNMLDVGEEDRESVKWALVDDLKVIAKAKIKDLQNDLEKELKVISENVKKLESIGYEISKTERESNRVKDFVNKYFIHVDIKELDEYFQKGNTIDEFVAIKNQKGSILKKLEQQSHYPLLVQFERDLNSMSWVVKELKKDYKKLEKLDEEALNKFGISIYSEEIAPVIEKLNTEIELLSDKKSIISSEENFNKIFNELETERKKFNSGIGDYEETLNSFKKLNYLLDNIEMQEQLPVKSKVEAEIESISDVETTIQVSVKDLEARLTIVKKMAQKDPTLEARIIVINKMIEKAKKYV